METTRRITSEGYIQINDREYVNLESVSQVKASGNSIVLVLENGDKSLYQPKDQEDADSFLKAVVGDE